MKRISTKPLMTAGLASAARTAWSAPASRQRRSILSTDFSDSASSSDVQRQDKAARNSPTAVSRVACAMMLVGKGALWLALVSGDRELLLVLKGGAGLSASMVVLAGVGVAAGEEEGWCWSRQAAMRRLST